MRVNDIRKLSYNDLERELENSREELQNLRFRLATRQLTNYREINKVKKTISRIQTIMREMELARS